jgi:hypothetical protein
MHDESVFKETNTSILNQIGQPPPSSVLIGLIETVGGTPDVVAAVVDWSESQTTWDVYACRGDIVAHVRGQKNISDWFGGLRDEIGSPADVVAAAYRISNARSLGAEALVSVSQYEGFARECRAKWVVSFDGGRLELDEHAPKYGRYVGEVAHHIRDRFVGAAR